MQRFLLYAAGILLALAWLSPYHYMPWLTFSSEMFTYASLFCLLAYYWDRALKIPQMQWLWFVIALIPLGQWCFGIELYFSKALLSSCYLFGFGAAAVLGVNLSREVGLEKILKYFASITFYVGLITASIALLQTFGLEKKLWGVMHLIGARPYANFAQPNNMATFLLMSLMASFYLFEKRMIPTWLSVIGGILMLIVMTWSQSRTPWIASCILTLYVLFKYEAQSYRINKCYIILWPCIYLLCLVFLPSINHFLVSDGVSHADLATVTERASTGHARLGIWAQMLYAIREQPWFGYGWNQTSVAQIMGANFISHDERTNSAHNIILELLVWNGVILGSLIIAYLSYWIFKLNQAVKTKETLIATLMVIPVFVHSMLEFPQNYAYFLFPVGFLLGLIQSEIKEGKCITLTSNINTGILVASILLYGLIWRDYNNAVQTLAESRQHAESGVFKQPKNNIILLTEYRSRAQWYYLNRFSYVDQQQLNEIRKVVLVSPTNYDLFKYAQLLAFNGQTQQAIRQLLYIDGLYHVRYKDSQLVSNPKVNDVTHIPYDQLPKRL
ncbi:PglL family O-oligosaccharyltransferase [Acinetobacter nectaris]|uniref:PglL family O-oligosaccharyltransferase n=1 Tax=Acinetobacter nectaris TaxID=1219382 RepID=UPI001F46A57F|nr:O-antigen ligase family protein [Acinetobacter nectaris]MCF9034234.1 O-antigen ligase C-terminal domain-containing protein [Acinetobacter nectaris]